MELSIDSPLNVETLTSMAINQLEISKKTEKLKDYQDFSSLNWKLVIDSDNEIKQEFIDLLFEKLVKGSGDWLIFFKGEKDILTEGLEKLKNVLHDYASSLAILHQKKLINDKAGNLGVQVLFRKKVEKVEEIPEVRIAVLGNVDSGKSTFLGVMTRQTLDNGRGSARNTGFKHKHELETGRTSSISQAVVGFTEKGEIVGGIGSGKNARRKAEEQVALKSSKLISFIDLCGHSRYFKTTLFGITGCSPDFAVLMIAANNGIVGSTREHLGCLIALQVPVFVMITKIDMCPPNIRAQTIQHLTKLLKGPGARINPVLVKKEEDIFETCKNWHTKKSCPIFQISNVTGEGLPLVRKFLQCLPTKQSGLDSVENNNVNFQIDEIYSVPGVGTVIAGCVKTGFVKTGDTLYLGPDNLGNFASVVVKSIQRKRVNVNNCRAGQSATFALKKMKRSFIRRGMVALSKELVGPTPSKIPMSLKNDIGGVCLEFLAEVLILFHSTTILPNKYCASLHCGNVRQTTKIISITTSSPTPSAPSDSSSKGKEKNNSDDVNVLRSGDRALVRFKFIVRPEWILVGSRLIFREGKTKGVGKVIEVFPMNGC